MKNDQFVYYATTEPSNGKNLCVKKNCPCTKNVAESVKNDEEESVYFTPYMLVNEEDPPLKSKACCSCTDIEPEKKCPVRRKSESKINISFQFGNFNGKELQKTAKKNFVQVLLPENYNKENFGEIQKAGDRRQESMCPCPEDEDESCPLPERGFAIVFKNRFSKNYLLGAQNVGGQCSGFFLTSSK